MKNIIFSTLFIAACFSCSSPTPKEQQIIGKWIQPIPGMDGVQGIALEKDGSASSINMSTLLFEKWMLQDGKLILLGKSIGNRTTFSFTDTLEIVKLTPDSLHLRKDDLSMQFERQTE